MENSKETKCGAFEKVAIALAISAFILGVVSFFMPPKGQIDSSVIAFTGEIFALNSLFFAWWGVKRGIDAKITRENGKTEVKLDNPDTNE